jgi:hypothetical protein
VLRAVYALHDLGLVRCPEQGPRLAFVRPTDAGLAAEYATGASHDI